MQADAEPLLADHLTALVALLGRSHAVDGPVSRSEYTLLALTATQGEQRTCDLAEAGGLDPSTTSRRVAALVERGVLTRTPDPGDGRAHRIALTGAGREVLDGERRRRAELVGLALEDWPAADRATLADLLGRLQTSLARVAGGTDTPVRSVADPTEAAPDAADRERTFA